MDLKTLQTTPPWEWPEEARALLLGILRDPGAEAADRRTAAALAGEYTVIDDDLARTLIAIAGDGEEHAELRCIAAISLGPALEHAGAFEFNDPEDILLSEETFHDVRRVLHGIWLDAAAPEIVRRRTLEAAVRAPEQWHHGAVRAAYQRGDPGWQLTAVFCMRFLPGFDDLILEAVSSSRPEVRREAILAAGTWELEAAWPRAAEVLAQVDPERSLLLAAIEAAAALRPQQAPEILGPLVDSDDEEISFAAAEALGLAEALGGDEEDEEFLH